MIYEHWVSKNVVFTMIYEQWVSNTVVFTMIYSYLRGTVPPKTVLPFSWMFCDVVKRPEMFYSRPGRKTSINIVT
jgi:hypothetical protein